MRQALSVSHPSRPIGLDSRREGPIPRMSPPAWVPLISSEGGSRLPSLKDYATAERKSGPLCVYGAGDAI